MLEELLHSISVLNKVENKKPILEREIYELDGRTQDLLHYLEYNEFSQYYLNKISRELQLIRRERREKKNELALVNCLITHTLKLNTSGNREFLINSLKKYY